MKSEKEEIKEKINLISYCGNRIKSLASIFYMFPPYGVCISLQELLPHWYEVPQLKIRGEKILFFNYKHNQEEENLYFINENMESFHNNDLTEDELKEINQFLDDHIVKVKN